MPSPATAPSPLRAVLFDVDGTLVDTNFVHTTSWWQALREHGHTVPMAIIHRAAGLGADKILDYLLGDGRDDDEDVVAAHDALLAAWHDRLSPLPGAVDLLLRCDDAGLAVVLASSAGPSDLEVLGGVLGCDDVLTAATSSGDAERSKPDTDILEVALRRAGASAAEAVFVGDAVWDMRASRRLALPCVRLEGGGTSAAELTDADADELWSTPADLLDHWSESVPGKGAAV